MCCVLGYAHWMLIFLEVFLDTPPPVFQSYKSFIGRIESQCNDGIVDLGMDIVANN